MQSLFPPPPPPLPPSHLCFLAVPLPSPFFLRRVTDAATRGGWCSLEHALVGLYRVPATTRRLNHRPKTPSQSSEPASSSWQRPDPYLRDPVISGRPRPRLPPSLALLSLRRPSHRIPRRRELKRRRGEPDEKDFAAVPLPCLSFCLLPPPLPVSSHSARSLFLSLLRACILGITVYFFSRSSLGHSLGEDRRGEGTPARFVISGTNEGRASCDACTRTSVQDRYIARENQFSVFFFLRRISFGLLIANSIKNKKNGPETLVTSIFRNCKFFSKQ